MDTNKEKIPYSPDQITVQKHGGKRTASAFCAFRSKKPVNPRPPSIPPSVSCESDHDDAMSAVSDVSDLSVMSINSLSGDSGFRCQNGTDKRRYFPSLLPAVHGQKPVDMKVQVRRLNRQLALMKSENEEYQKQAFFVTGHKEELFKLKSQNFELSRENANLKSQLSSTKEVVQDLKQVKIELENAAKQTNEDKLKADVPHHNGVYEVKSQLRGAHDEIFRLKTELTKHKLDVKRKEDEIMRQEQRYKALSESTSDYGSQNQRLHTKARELETELESVVRVKVASEHNLQVLQSERETILKSRDWYREQMHQSQETRAAAQRDLMSLQKELATKDSSLEFCRAENLQLNKTLADEREKTLKEKEDMKRQLEELEVEIKDREVVSIVQNEIIDPTPPPSPEKSVLMKIKKYEEEINQLSEVVGTVEAVRADLAVANSKLDEKTKLVNELLLKNDSLEAKMDEIQTSNSDLKLDVSNLERELNERMSSTKLLKTEIQDKTEMLQKLQETKVKDKIELGALKTECSELKETLASAKDQLNELEAQRRHLRQVAELKESELENLSSRNKHLTNELQLSKSELDELRFTKEENLELKKSLLKLSETETCLTVAKDEKIQLHAAQGILKAKVNELQDTNKDLVKALDILKSEITERNREVEELKSAPATESDAHTNESEMAANALEVANSKIQELEDSLHHKQGQIFQLQSENEEKDMEVEKLRSQIETLKIQRDDDAESLENVTEIQSNKITRLECSNAVLEAEVSHLSDSIGQLEEQVLELEKENGKLKTESVQNSTLKAQVDQLQKDIMNDTCLRKELLEKLDSTRHSLTGEMAKLEKVLEEEKASHASTKERLLLQEHDASEQRIEKHSLTLGLEAANLTIAKLETKVTSMKHQYEGVRNFPDQSGSKVIDELNNELHKKSMEAKDLLEAQESDKMAIAILEDRLRDLNFSLHQKNTELMSAQTMATVRKDSHDREVADLKAKCTSLRKEVLDLSQKVDVLAEERNSYRAQVQDMNVALRNSLEHIKRLRASKSSPSSPMSRSPSLDESDLTDLLKRSSTPAGRNLTNLQSCLASLKSEMAVLQSRLAPVAGPEASRPSSVEKDEIITTTTASHQDES